MKKIGNYRWKIVVLLFFATTVNYITRQIIGILKPYISDELSWSESDYGYIVAAFQVAYAIGLVTTGKVLDKLGTRLSYSWAMIIWSISCMLHAAVISVTGFIAARFVLGIGQAANFPAAVKAVAEWFPKKERAFANGLFNAGSSFGAIAAPILVVAITVSMGWQWAFILTGALGFVWVVFWLIFYHLPENHTKIKKEELNYITQDRNESDSGLNIKWIELFKYRQTYALLATRFISDWVWWFLLFWTPAFLNTVYAVDITEVVLPLIIIYLMSIFGGIGGGWLSSRLIKSGKSIDYSRKIAILLCAFIVMPVILVPQLQNLWLAVVFISFAAAGHQGWAANMFALVSDIYPRNIVGSVVGLISFGAAVGGALSAAFIGLLLEITGSYFLIFLFAGSVYFINWLIVIIFIRDIRPI